MKHTLLYILAAIFSVTASPGIYAADIQPQAVPASADTNADSTLQITWEDSLKLRLDSVVNNSPLLQTSQLGLLIYDLDADSTLYASNEKQTMRPASTMKLVTAITALDRLRPTYCYKTRLCYSGTINDSILHGNVYIIGCMDPMISADDLRTMSKSIRQAGIDSIHGNIYADRSMKDDLMYGEGWCWDDNNPMLSPLVYNRRDDLMPTLLDIMRQDSIGFSGIVATDVCPENATTINELPRTIQQILRPMLKNSDNLYAESLFYHIGLSTGKPSTAKKSKALAEKLLIKTGTGNAPHRFADGSGLSLYNYLSPEIEVAFLRYAYSNADIYKALYDALPIAAIDGTLEKRMANTPAVGNIHAKTGTLSGVSSLAGYCKGGNGHTLCFSIMNLGVMQGIQARNLQDAICAIICK